MYEGLKLQLLNASTVWRELQEFTISLPSILQRDMLIITFHWRIAELAVAFERAVPAVYLGSSSKNASPYLQRQLQSKHRLPSQHVLDCLAEATANLISHSTEMTKLFPTPFGPNKRVFTVFHHIIVWAILHYSCQIRVRKFWKRLKQEQQTDMVAHSEDRESILDKDTICKVLDNFNSSSHTIEDDSEDGGETFNPTIRFSHPISLPQGHQKPTSQVETVASAKLHGSSLLYNTSQRAKWGYSTITNTSALAAESTPSPPLPKKIPWELQDPLGFITAKGSKTLVSWSAAATQWSATTKAPHTPLLTILLKGATKFVKGDFLGAKQIWESECLKHLDETCMRYQKALLESYMLACDVLHLCHQQQLHLEYPRRDSATFAGEIWMKWFGWGAKASKNKGHVEPELNTDALVGCLKEAKEKILCFGEMSNLYALLLDSLREAVSIEVGVTNKTNQKSDSD
jgi:hypothetical protein